MAEFKALSEDAMQKTYGGGFLGKYIVGKASKFLGPIGGFGISYLYYLYTHEKEANALANQYYKESSRPNYNTD